MNNNNEIDYLTGLLSRKGLYASFDSLSDVQEITAFFLDLDNFKTVNDLYGHSFGDNVLSTVGNILKNCTENAYAVRMGGDEFFLMLPYKTIHENVVKIAESIFENIAKEQNQNEILSLIGLSIGIVENVEGNLDVAISKSDFAMYHAKKHGKNQFIFYDEVKEELNKNKLITDKIKFALESENFSPLFSPVVNLKTGCIEQLEVHMAWSFDEFNTMYATEFRPVVEKNGLSRKLDLHLFEMMCKEIVNLNNPNMNTRYSVLISAQSLLDNFLCTKLQNIMDKYSLNGSFFDIAISEDFFDRRDIDKVIKQMHKLVALGFTLSLIKFGENFYSLKYLRRLPITTLKIEPSYLKEMLKSENKKDSKILQFIIDIAKTLEFNVSGGEMEDLKMIEKLKMYEFDCAEGSCVAPLLSLNDLKEKS